MGWSLSMGVGKIADYPDQNYTTVSYQVRLNWDNYATFYGYPSSASGSIVYNIGAGNVTVPISVSAPSSAGDGSASGYVVLSSGTLNISHNLTGGISSVTGSASYSNSWVGSLSASDFVGNLTNFNRSPSTPSSVSGAVQGDKSILVTVAPITGPGGTPTLTTTYNVEYSQDGGGYTGLQSSGSNVISFAGLAKGKTYTFRAYTSNAAGSSGYVTSSSVFLSSGGKRWSGSAWISNLLGKRWNGSAWVDLTIAKRWSGSAWVDLQ